MFHPIYACVGVMCARCTTVRIAFTSMGTIVAARRRLCRVFEAAAVRGQRPALSNIEQCFRPKSCFTGFRRFSSHIPAPGHIQIKNAGLQQLRERARYGRRQGVVARSPAQPDNKPREPSLAADHYPKQFAGLARLRFPGARCPLMSRRPRLAPSLVISRSPL